MKSHFLYRIQKLTKEILDIFLLKGLYRRSFSQEGEDLILDRIFDQQASGVYIDIGAHHPVRFSNTYLFYRRGWSGICIDPSPNAIRLFKSMRPKDISLEVGVSDQLSRMTYFMFDEPALNTFSEALAQERVKNTPYKLIGNSSVPVKPLSQILDETLRPGTKIDFMSVDVEGLDFQVLASNDWLKYRPRVILAEALNDEVGQRIRELMASNHYKVIARTFNTEFYEDNLKS